MRGPLAHLGLLAFAGAGSYWHGRFDGLSMLVCVVAGAGVFVLLARAASEPAPPLPGEQRAPEDRS